jgi:hypothetical protein
MKLRKPNITTVIIFVGLFCTTGYFFNKIVSSQVLSSGISQIIDKFRPEGKTKLIASAEKLNKLVDSIKKAETRLTENLAEREEYVSSATVNRQEISKQYREIADLISKESINIQVSNYKMYPLIEDIVKGLIDASNKSNKPGSLLPRFYPQNIGFLSLGFSEMTNAMTFEIKGEFMDTVEKANSLMDLISKDEEQAKKDVSRRNYYIKEALAKRQKLSDLSTKLSTTISEDLGSIQMNNPRIVKAAKDFIRNSQELAISFREDNSPLPKFHPQYIHY